MTETYEGVVYSHDSENTEDRRYQRQLSFVLYRLDLDVSPGVFRWTSEGWEILV